MYLVLTPYVEEHKKKEAEWDCVSKVKDAKYKKVDRRKLQTNSPISLTNRGNSWRTCC
jgi:hypothetical protein